jgi:hypothetical protein
MPVQYERIARAEGNAQPHLNPLQRRGLEKRIDDIRTLSFGEGRVRPQRYKLYCHFIFDNYYF